MYESMRRTRRAIAACLSLAVTFIGTAGPASAAAVDCGDNSGPFEVEVIARHLEVPWAMAFSPDGRLFVTERPGRIRVIEDGTLLHKPWTTIPVPSNQGTEIGLMGMAIDPDFEDNGYVYVCYTYFRTEQGLLANRVVRIHDRDGVGDERTTLLQDIPGALYHDGCAVAFGPDRKLYVTTGDARQEELAADIGSLAGKILRMNPDGSVPPDNPFENSLVWSYGHRNPQGLAWQPDTNVLFSTEHGTNNINELNVIEAGGNYGWPTERFGKPDPRFRTPILVHESPPGGATFVTSDLFPGLQGSLLFAGLARQQLYLVGFNKGTQTISEQRHFLDNAYGRLRDVIEGPDGYLYVSTSNRDGRGMPSPDDDRILKLKPAVCGNAAGTQPD